MAVRMYTAHEDFITSDYLFYSVMSSLRLACQQDGAEGSGEQAAGSARTDATAALKPFLHEHAAHFWHELR